MPHFQPYAPAAALIVSRRIGQGSGADFVSPWPRAAHSPAAWRGPQPYGRLAAHDLANGPAPQGRSRYHAGLGLVVALGSSVLLWAGLVALLF